MRSFIAAVMLLATSVPALADFVPVPEPEMLSLLAVGALGLLISRRSK